MAALNLDFNAAWAWLWKRVGWHQAPWLPKSKNDVPIGDTANDNAGDDEPSHQNSSAGPNAGLDPPEPHERILTAPPITPVEPQWVSRLRRLVEKAGVLPIDKARKLLRKVLKAFKKHAVREMKEYRAGIEERLQTYQTATDGASAICDSKGFFSREHNKHVEK